jgi:hypothetical protein
VQQRRIFASYDDCSIVLNKIQQRFHHSGVVGGRLPPNS